MTTETKVDVVKVMAANIERDVETIQGKVAKGNGSLEKQMFRHHQRCLLYLDAEGKVKGRPKWMMAFSIISKDVHARCPELKAQYDDLVAQVKASRGKAAKAEAEKAKAKEDAKAAKKAEKEAAKAAEKKAKAEAKAKAKAAKKASKPVKKAANPGNKKSTKKVEKKSAGKAKAKS